MQGCFFILTVPSPRLIKQQIKSIFGKKLVYYMYIHIFASFN
jgi:hypothetical protein